MPDYYLISHASVTKNYITAHRARELYAEEAQRASEVGLFGDLETGFYFWSIETENGLKLVHHSVTPVPADEVPEDICDRLDQTTPPNAP